MYFLLICTVFASCLSSSVTSMTCNGLSGLCKLPISKVTLAGSHNAGAGFDGIMNYHTAIGKIAALSCFYRCQSHSIYDQLELGIRYLDIDTCWDEGSKQAWSCHEGAYGGTIAKMMFQVDQWMNKPKNRNEVVMIHFNRDVAEDSRQKTGKSIITILKHLWGKSSKSLKIQDNPLYATLEQSIKANKRIHVIIHTTLTQSSTREKWMIAQSEVGYTWTSKWVNVIHGCWNLIPELQNKCKEKAKYYTFVRLDYYLSKGLCVSELASVCNPFTQDATQRCQNAALQHKNTVNFIVSDYVDKRVVEAARKANLINVNKFKSFR